MRASTWGAHQEEAARALQQLVADGVERAHGRLSNRARLPGGLDWRAEDVRQLLGCREAVLDALSDQLSQVSLGGPRVRGDVGPGELRRVRMAGQSNKFGLRAPRIATEPGGVVAAVVAARPRTPRELLAPPSEALGTPSANPVVELWRHAAVHLTAGVVALGAAAERPWMSDPGAAWWLLGDTATVCETVVVLDAFMVRPQMFGTVDLGGFADLTDPTSPFETSTAATGQARIDRVDRNVAGREELRIALSMVATMAATYGVDSSAETAVAHPSATARESARLAGQSTTRGGVVRVERLEDLVLAQRHLAQLLPATMRQAAPAAPADAGRAGGSEQRMTVDLAKTLVGVQLAVSQTVLGAARNRVGGHKLMGTVRDQADLLAEVQVGLGGVVDRRRGEPIQHVAWQALEVQRGMERFGEQLGSCDLGQLAALGEATHQVSRRVAISVRAGLNDTRRPERPTAPTLGVRGRRGQVVGEKTKVDRFPVAQSLTNLATSRWPTSVNDISTSARQGLRSRLRETPTSRGIPSPFVPHPVGSLEQSEPAEPATSERD